MDHVITIFGSSTPEEHSEEFRVAYECGRLLAIAGFTVCNGGYDGTMRASAMGARQSGGKTIGVGVSSWSRKPNEWIEQQIVASSLIERLMKLVELGDAYVVLPGGTGTLLELACILEFINKGIIEKRPIVLVGDFWDDVVETADKVPGSSGQTDVRSLVHEARSPEELVEYLRAALLQQ